MSLFNLININVLLFIQSVYNGKKKTKLNLFLV